MRIFFRKYNTQFKTEKYKITYMYTSLYYKAFYSLHLCEIPLIRKYFLRLKKPVYFYFCFSYCVLGISGKHYLVQIQLKKFQKFLVAKSGSICCRGMTMCACCTGSLHSLQRAVNPVVWWSGLIPWPSPEIWYRT